MDLDTPPPQFVATALIGAKIDGGHYMLPPTDGAILSALSSECVNSIPGGHQEARNRAGASDPPPPPLPVLTRLPDIVAKNRKRGPIACPKLFRN